MSSGNYWIYRSYCATCTGHVESFSFTVIKPWYFSNLAIAGYALLLLISIAIILPMQKNKYLADNTQLRSCK
jgi:hypothetical protein